MMTTRWNRRQVLAAAAGLPLLPGIAAATEVSVMATRKIPASGEALPVIGIGTYSVFDVESTPAEIATRHEIVEMMIRQGGSLVDTSPMYNRAEQVVGDVIRSGIDRGRLFLATKVWTDGATAGREQMRRSAELMATEVIDLMQVHNLRDTESHMRTIRNLQSEGLIRYSGLTHYTASAHDALAQAMQEFKPQFIQVNYSLGEREAEARLLPMAQDLGVAVLVNRPFQAGRLFRAVANLEVPAFARGIADTWGQFFLKYIISHPAVTCVIPATSKPRHMLDNLGAGFGEMPDALTRQRMAEFITQL